MTDANITSDSYRKAVFGHCFQRVARAAPFYAAAAAMAVVILFVLH